MRCALPALLAVWSIGVSALPITVDGYGKDYTSALSSAKIAALEKATGTWISSEHFLKNGKLSEEIVQYNGGVIKSYEVVKYVNGVITITADVDVVKDNRVIAKSADIPTHMRDTLLEQQANRKKIEDAVRFLDSKGKAFGVVARESIYVNRGDITEVTLKATISWNPKWETDVKALGKTINNIGSISRDTHERVSASIISSTFSNSPMMIPAVILYGVTKPDPIEQSDQHQICFINDSCYVIGVPFTMFDSDIRIMVEGTKDRNKIYNTSILFNDTNLYEMIAAGDEKRGWLGSRVTYNNPTVVAKTNRQMNVTFSFLINTSQLSQIDRFNFTIQ